MKVLIISGSFLGSRCGVGDYTYHLASSLSRLKDIEVSVMTSRDIDPIDAVALKYKILSSVDRWDFLSYRHIFKIIKEDSPEIVHIQYPTVKYNNPFPIAILLLPFFIRWIFKDIKVVVTIHDFAIGRMTSRIKNFAILFPASRIIISNERDRSAILTIYPFLSERVKKIYMGSNIEVAECSEEEKRFLKKSLCPKDEKLLLYFGFITKGKKLNILMDAVKRLSAWSLPVKLAVIGPPQNRRDVSLKRRLEDYAKRIGMADAISWLGHLPPNDVSRFIQSADLCILPYERGADLRRGALISCVIHRIPVISTINRAYAVDEELERLGIARLLDLEKDDLACTIKDLLGDAEARESIVHSMECVKDLFLWDNIANEHLRIYEEVIDREPR